MDEWKKDARRDVVFVDIDALVPQDHLLRKIEKAKLHNIKQGAGIRPCSCCLYRESLHALINVLLLIPVMVVIWL